MATEKEIRGKRIRDIRNRLGLSQEQLGKRLGGITKGSISGYEAGDVNPTPEALIELARLGDVSLDWILTGVESGGSPVSVNSIKKKGEIAATIEPGRPRLGKSEGGVVGSPGRGEAANKEINVHEGVMMTTKVLSSNTGYANALWHNLKSFDAAVDREAEVGEMKEMMAEMMKKMERLEKAIATPEGDTKKRDEVANS